MGGRRGGRRAVVIALAVGLLVALVPAAAGASASAEASFVAKVNAERAAQGLPALHVDGQLTEVARGWTAQMAATSNLAHRPNLRAAVAGDPELVGENVGTSHITGAGQGELVDELHRAFMASPGHRANVLGDWTHIGVAVGLTNGGDEMWVTVNFKRVAPPAAVAAGDPSAPSPEPELDATAADATTDAAAQDVTAGEGAPAPAAAAAEPVTRKAPYRVLSPSVRAHFALAKAPLLPRQFAGSATAV
jgi:uncharacterized protein YkwD